MLQQPFFIPAVVFLVFSLPLILELMPRQWAIGIRTRKTLADDATWYRANRFGGWAIGLSSLFYLALAWILPCLAPCGTNFTQWLVHLAGFALPLFFSSILTRWYVNRL